MKRILSLRFLAKLVAGFGVLCLIAFAVENWTGARALAKAKEDFLREGEVLDFASLQDKPISGGFDFFAIEQLDGISAPRTEEESLLHQKLRSLDWMAAAFGKNPRTPRPNLNGGCVLGEPLDVKSASAYLSEISYVDTAPDADATQVLAAIDRMHPLLKQLSDAAPDRPEAGFEVDAGLDYTVSPFQPQGPYLNGCIQAAKGLSLRAQIAATSGDAESSVRSIQASLRFTQALGQRPLLIGLLCAITTSTYDANSIWLMLHRHTVSAEQLSRLQADLERLDFMRSLAQGIRHELVWQGKTIDWFKINRDGILSFFPQFQFPGDQTEPAWYASAAIHIIPAGWFDHNAANALRLESTFLLKPVLEQDGRVIVRRLDEMEGVWKEHRIATSPHHTLSMLAFPSYRMIIEQALYCEALRRQTITAIAIERYRLRHSKVPEALSELVPEFLPAVPLDIMDLAPMRYRVEGDGTFTLWSIARDGKDDGGQTAGSEGGETCRQRAVCGGIGCGKTEV